MDDNKRLESLKALQYPTRQNMRDIMKLQNNKITTLEADNAELVECLKKISTKAIEPVCMILATNLLNKHKPSKEPK